jgi:hypothetical protein
MDHEIPITPPDTIEVPLTFADLVLLVGHVSAQTRASRSLLFRLTDALRELEARPAVAEALRQMGRFNSNASHGVQP